ncbi:MAG: class I SAM-dependent DNA methyltransferase [Bacteroidota bacterium]
MKLFDNPQQYYRAHAQIYDLTRWTFLFGRNQLIDTALSFARSPKRILEIGCGTGMLLQRLNKKVSETHLVGIDLSRSMLTKASSLVPEHGNTISLIHSSAQAYEDTHPKPFDLVICSYSLTIMGDDMLPIISMLPSLLTTHGYLAVVDFHDSPFDWFKKWMAMNHARFDPQMLIELRRHFREEYSSIQSAYLGWWSYFTFIGQAMIEWS